MQDTDNKHTDIRPEENASQNKHMVVELVAKELLARNPHPIYAKSLMVFGQFVGAWDMDVIFYNKDEEKIYQQKGEWLFSWVLDGRAIQDVLIYPNPDMNMNVSVGERRIGTSLRYYNPNQDIWKVIWLGAVTGNIVFLTGRTNGEEIMLKEENSPDDTRSTWIFTDIEQNRFHWKGFISKDLGSSWILEQEMFGYRKKL